MKDRSPKVSLPTPRKKQATGPWSDLALHTIGWRAFQDLCSQVCEVALGRPVEIFREAQDGGQDAVFLIPSNQPSMPIGTVQCKHSSDGGRSLKASDLNAEVDHVRELVDAEQADTYVFMTRRRVDAPVAKEIRTRLHAMGVRKPHILGRQYIVRTIRGSAKLRALVPQVYGLGDLGAIMDERIEQQSRALLENWVPKLRTYVPTQAHRQAVHAIQEHRVVLLLGNPSSGKSAIGAIISTIASENPDSTVLVLTSPRDFENAWNPSDPGRFFWIDDAFGSNVLREDYVQDWESAFPKLRAAMNNGNRFLLTSRRHIYEAARRRLGHRNLAEFANCVAVVDVGDLTDDEKARILYNHVNFGAQNQRWKSTVKPYLPVVAAVPDFLPGIAERLGDPNFTTSLVVSEGALVRFMEEPREHLVDTVDALDAKLQAALMLVYVHQSGFDPVDHDRDAAQAVADLTGLGLAQIQEAFLVLKGSFLKLSGPRWTFSHPTISDALTEILSGKPHMMGALVRGATIDMILNNFTCEETFTTQDTLVVPQSLSEALVDRLVRTPDEPLRNRMLFRFLSSEASDLVFTRVLERCPTILYRRTWGSGPTGRDPRLRTYALAYGSGLLQEALRDEAVEEFETAALERDDVSFLARDGMLAMFPPRRLLDLGLALRGKVLPGLESRVEQICEEADLDDDFEGLFEGPMGIVDYFEQRQGGIDDETADLVRLVRREIQTSIERLEERRAERDEETESDSDWGHIVTQENEATSPSIQPATRSVFEDVDA